MEVNLIFKCIFRYRSINKAQILRNNLIEDQTSQCRLNIALNDRTIFHRHRLVYINRLMQCNLLVLICQQRIIHIREIMSQNISCRTDDTTVPVSYIFKINVIIGAHFISSKVCPNIVCIRINLVGYRCCAFLAGMVCQTVHGQIINTQYHIL